MAKSYEKFISEKAYNRKDDVLEIVKQPKGSQLCSQSCIAMVAGITLNDSIKLFGHDTKSNLAEVAKILKNLEIPHTPWNKVDNRKKYQLPSVSLIRIERAGRRLGHLIVHYNGKVYDPSEGIFNSKNDFLQFYKLKSKKWRIDAYSEILVKI